MNPKLLQLLSDNARADKALPGIRVEASADYAHVYLMDVIDSYWGASAASLITALAAAGSKPVKLHINSPGGDVFEGLAMAAAISAHPQPIEALVEGVAASAATGVALACQSVAMLEGSLFMIHCAWSGCYGNKAELRSMADLLEKVDQGIAATYTRKTGQSLDQVNTWMDAETWFTAEEAKAAGFVQLVTPAGQPAASASASASASSSAQATAQACIARWNLSAYANAPAALRRSALPGQQAVSGAAAAMPQARVVAAVSHRLDAPRLEAAAPADAAYLQALTSIYKQASDISAALVIGNSATPLRGFAEDVIEDCAGDSALMQLWLQTMPPAGPESKDTSAAAIAARASQAADQAEWAADAAAQAAAQAQAKARRQAQFNQSIFAELHLCAPRT